MPGYGKSNSDQNYRSEFWVTVVWRWPVNCSSVPSLHPSFFSVHCTAQLLVIPTTCYPLLLLPTGHPTTRRVLGRGTPRSLVLASLLIPPRQASSSHTHSRLPSPTYHILSRHVTCFASLLQRSHPPLYRRGPITEASKFTPGAICPLGIVLDHIDGLI